MTDPVKPPAGVIAPVPTTSTVPVDTKVPMFTKEQTEHINQLVISASIAAAQAAVAAMGKQMQSAPSQNQIIHQQCGVCKQALKACGGKHVKMVVFPVKYDEFAPYFLGAKINGVTYRSSNGNRAINIPACAQSTITNIITAFEDNERTVHIGRKKTHNSGSIGPSGKGFNPANAAWR